MSVNDCDESKTVMSSNVLPQSLQHKFSSNDLNHCWFCRQPRSFSLFLSFQELFEAGVQLEDQVRQFCKAGQELVQAVDEDEQPELERSLEDLLAKKQVRFSCLKRKRYLDCLVAYTCRDSAMSANPIAAKHHTAGNGGRWSSHRKTA